MSNAADKGATAWRAQRLAHSPHQRRWDSVDATTGHPARCRRRAKLFLQGAEQRSAVLDAIGIRAEERIRGQIGTVQHARAEKLEVAIGARTDGEGAIVSMKDLIGNDGRMLVTVAIGVFSGQQHVLRDVHQRRDRRTA